MDLAHKVSIARRSSEEIAQLHVACGDHVSAIRPTSLKDTSTLEWQIIILTHFFQRATLYNPINDTNEFRLKIERVTVHPDYKVHPINHNNLFGKYNISVVTDPFHLYTMKHIQLLSWYRMKYYLIPKRVKLALTCREWRRDVTDRFLPICQGLVWQVHLTSPPTWTAL